MSGNKCVMYKKLDYLALNPIIKTSQSVGIDVKTPSSFVLSPKAVVIIDTRVEFNTPAHTTLHVANRSSHAMHGILVNVGSIDGADMKNTIKVVLKNTTNETYIFNKGDSIAQLLVLEYQNRIIHFRLDSFFFGIITYNALTNNAVGLGLIPKVSITFNPQEIKAIDTRLIFAYLDPNTIYTIHPTTELRKLNIHVAFTLYCENKTRLELILHNRNSQIISLLINREYFRIIPVSIAIPVLKEVTMDSTSDVPTKRGLLGRCMEKPEEENQIHQHMVQYQLIKKDAFHPFVCDLYGNEHKYGFHINTNERVIISGNAVTKLPTSLIFYQNPGYYMHMFTPYNLSVQGLTLNGGIIDIDYQGEVFCIIHNHTDHEVILSRGTIIAFVVLIKNPNVVIYETVGCDCGLPIMACFCKTKKQLRLPLTTVRSTRGFGSTGN